MRISPIIVSVGFGLGLASFGCSANKSSSDTPHEAAEVVEAPVEPVEPASGESAPAGAVVDLSPGQAAVTVAPGTRLRWSFKSHASVGYDADYELDDSGVVVFVRRDTDYEQSEAQRAGKTGADAATGTFVFEAREPGTASLQLRAQFRGAVESEARYAITVVAAGD